MHVLIAIISGFILRAYAEYVYSVTPTEGFILYILGMMFYLIIHNAKVGDEK